MALIGPAAREIFDPSEARLPDVAHLGCRSKCPRMFLRDSPLLDVALVARPVSEQSFPELRRASPQLGARLSDVQSDVQPPERAWSKLQQDVLGRHSRPSLQAPP
jgi:hypothetical protein